MKTANQIASQVVDEYRFGRQFPVGKAQQEVLNALSVNVKINGHSHAQQIFDALGIVVSSRREGRATIPVVSKIGGGAGRNAGGDYDVWDAPSNGIDLSAIEKWMVK